VLAALVPPGVVTVILPLVPSEGGVAVREVAVGVPVIVPAAPLKLTPVAAKRFVPVIVTGEPKVGVKLVIVGAESGIVIDVALVAVPDMVLTVTGPETAPVGIFTEIELVPVTVNVGVNTPPMPTADTCMKLVPVIVMVDPTALVVGVNDVIVGAEGRAEACRRHVLVLASRFC